MTFYCWTENRWRPFCFFFFPFCCFAIIKGPIKPKMIKCVFASGHNKIQVSSTAVSSVALRPLPPCTATGCHVLEFGCCASGHFYLSNVVATNHISHSLSSSKTQAKNRSLNIFNFSLAIKVDDKERTSLKEKTEDFLGKIFR